MTEKMIKVRLFTWFEEVDSPVHGEVVLTERINHHGEVVDVTNDAYVERGEALDAFYTDEERAEIEDGTYTGEDAETVFSARGQQAAAAPAPAPALASGEQDATELGAYIKENKLTVSQTLALVPDDADEETLQKFIDAENIATDNDPRAGVIDPLERRQAEA